MQQVLNTCIFNGLLLENIVLVIVRLSALGKYLIIKTECSTLLQLLN